VPESPEAFADLPILEELGDALLVAFRRESEQRVRARRLPLPARPRRTAILVAVLVVLLAASAAAATLWALRGSPLPVPRDIPLEQTPAPHTARLSGVRAPDPDHGAPPWAVRLAHSRTGLVCSTVGQLVNGQFGLIGLDRRFRALPTAVADSCGQAQRDTVSLIGARVFTGRSAADRRTVVSGVAGPTLRSVAATVGGHPVRVTAAPGGVFAIALRGYPEDLQIELSLAYADGHRERYSFGSDPSVVPDPSGGPSWRVEALGFGLRPGQRGPVPTCVNFQPARSFLNPPLSPTVCGVLTAGRRPHGFFFAIRRIYNTRHFARNICQGSWKGFDARTAVYGIAGSDVSSVEVLGPGAKQTSVRISVSRAFLALFPPSVRPDELAVRIRRVDGSSLIRHGSANLVRPPGQCG
jgi:hypothetical protein